MRAYKLRGEKVGLAVMEKSDLEAFRGWISDPEVSVFLGPAFWRTYTREDEEEWYERTRKEQRTVVFSLMTLPEEKLIGNTSLFDIDAMNGRAELGIFIGDKEYWGKGYGTEATMLMLDYGFNALNLHSISLRVYSFNTRAIKCYEKAGFKMAGRLREAVLRVGERHDELFMDLLRGDFRAESKLPKALPSASDR